MTNQEKAESCGEFVRDGLDALGCFGLSDVAWFASIVNHGPHDLTRGPWIIERDDIVEGARQAGHWGRLALRDNGRS